MDRSKSYRCIEKLEFIFLFDFNLLGFCDFKRSYFEMLLEEPFDSIGCFLTKINPINIGHMLISEFKEIVGHAIKLNINCSKLGASKSKK